MRKITFIAALLSICLGSFSQVTQDFRRLIIRDRLTLDAVYPAEANEFSLLTANSTTRGILIPRMTTAQRDAISGMSTTERSLLIFNLTTGQFNFWNGSAWEILGAGAGGAYITSITNIGSSGPATVTGGVLNIPNYSVAGGGDAYLAGTQTFTGVNTFNGNTILSQFATTSNGTSANFNVGSAIGIWNTASTNLMPSQYSGTLYLRVSERGSATSTLGTAGVYISHVIGSQQANGSTGIGTHPLIASLGIRPVAYNSTANATVTKTALLHLDGTQTATVTEDNYSILQEGTNKNRLDGGLMLPNLTQGGTRMITQDVNGNFYWDNIPSGGSGGVTTYAGRSGAVVPIVGDYSSFYPILSGSYVNPPWIISLPYSKITGTPTIPAQLNAISGTGMNITGTYPNLTFNSTVVGGSGGDMYLANNQTITGNNVFTGSVIHNANVPFELVASVGNPQQLEFKFGSTLAGYMRQHGSGGQLLINASGRLALYGTTGIQINDYTGIGAVPISSTWGLFGASTTTRSNLRLPATGVNVTSPVDGDLWYNGTALNFRNGSTTVNLLAGGSSGITSLNGLTGGTQTFALGTGSLGVSSSGTVHTFNFPDASGSVRGLLTAANWTTFNNKAPTASPAFTGVPTAPTAAVGTNTTQLATTAFVRAQIENSVPEWDFEAGPGLSVDINNTTKVVTYSTSAGSLGMYDEIHSVTYTTLDDVVTSILSIPVTENTSGTMHIEVHGQGLTDISQVANYSFIATFRRGTTYPIVHELRPRASNELEGLTISSIPNFLNILSGNLMILQVGGDPNDDIRWRVRVGIIYNYPLD